MCLPLLCQKFARAVALWLAVDGRPMNTVSTPAFAEVCASVGLQPPSRDYMTRLITKDLALEADMFMMDSLAGAATLSIVTDGWTSPSGTAHFEGVHVQALVETAVALELRCFTFGVSRVFFFQ
jgi:hypothetical protein